MPTPTYTPLSTVTLTSSAASVTFSGIPNTYRDLILIINGATTNASDSNFIMRFNSDTGTNYSYVRMSGTDVNTAESDSNTLNSIRLPVGTTGGRGMNTVQIMDYSATDKHKTVLSRESVMSISFVAARASRWANTAAISTILVGALTNSIASGTTLSLYGISA